MLPWRSFLKPGVNLNVTLSTALGELTASKDIVVPTDELIPALNSVIQEEGLADDGETQTESASARPLREVAGRAASHE